MGQQGLPSVESFTRAAPSLAQRIEEADVDKDGQLSKDELLQVFADELSARRSKKRMGYAAAVALGLLVVALAANAGLTYAVVALSQDIQVSPSGALVSKDGGEVIQVRSAMDTRGLAEVALSLAPDNVTRLHSLVLPLPGGGGFVWHQVSAVEVRPGNRTTIYTDAGAVVTVMAAQGGGAPTITLNSAAMPGATSGVVDTDTGAGSNGRRLRGTTVMPTDKEAAVLEPAVLEPVVLEPEVCYIQII